MQSKKPKIIGIIAAKKVHIALPVSFFMVIRVVEQGEWKRARMIKHIAVTCVQPFATKSSRS